MVFLGPKQAPYFDPPGRSVGRLDPTSRFDDTFLIYLIYINVTLTEFNRYFFDYELYSI